MDWPLMNVTASSLFFVAAGLLAVAGVTKLGNPAPTARALENVGLDVGSLPVRCLGGLELVVGVSSLFRPGLQTGAALACLYGGLTAFLVWLRFRPDSASLSCGCLGTQESPPSLLHILSNLVAIACGVWVALHASPSVIGVIKAEGVAAVPYGLSLFVLGWLTTALMVYGPRLMSAYRPPIKSDQNPIPRLSAEQALTAAGIQFDDPSLWPPDDPPIQDGGSVTARDLLHQGEQK
jgi:hypothetical protein